MFPLEAFKPRLKTAFVTNCDEKKDDPYSKTLCLNRLRLMCRKQSETYRYKPLGVLKSSMATQPTYG